MDTLIADVEQSATTPRPYDGVLVPLDGSPLAGAAIPAAEALAAELEVPVRFLTVSRPDASSKAAVAAATRHVPARQIVPVSADDIATGIVERAGDRRMLVCMASHGRGRIGALALGSVAGEVVRNAAAPVVLVGPRFDPAAFTRPRRIVAAVDGSSWSEQILPVAADWAAALHAHLDLVAVVDPATGRAAPPTSLNVLTAGYLNRLARTASRPGRMAGWETLHGADPADAIIDHVRNTDGTLIAATTHGRTGIQQLRLGSVAMRLVHRSPTPLLIHRPRTTTPRQPKLPEPA